MGRGATRKHSMFELEPATPGAPRVCIEWLDRNHEMGHLRPHGHQFLALAYFERGGGLQQGGSQVFGSWVCPPRLAQRPEASHRRNVARNMGTANGRCA